MVRTRRQAGAFQMWMVALPAPWPSPQSAAASSDPSGLSSSPDISFVPGSRRRIRPVEAS